MTNKILWHRPISILLTIFISNVFIQSPSNAWDGGTWGREEVGGNTVNWVVNSYTLGTIGFNCVDDDKSKYVLQVKLPLTKEIKKQYGIKSKKKSAWINVATGVNGGKVFNFTNGKSMICPEGYSALIFNWFPPAGVESVSARTQWVQEKKGRKIGALSKTDGVILNEDKKHGIVIHPQMKNAIQQASQQVAQGSGNSAPQSNSGSAPQTRTSSAPFVNPYNISGVGRVLQDGSIEYGVYYGGNQQLANDLSSGDFYAAAQNTATSASQAQQMCIASNLASGNIGAAVSC
jgi:hypothetical protein